MTIGGVPTLINKAWFINPGLTFMVIWEYIHYMMVSMEIISVWAFHEVMGVPRLRAGWFILWNIRTLNG